MTKQNLINEGGGVLTYNTDGIRNAAECGNQTAIYLLNLCADKRIETEGEWYMELNRTSPYDRARLRELAQLAQVRGWSWLADEIEHDIETLERMKELAARQASAWSEFKPLGRLSYQFVWRKS